MKWFKVVTTCVGIFRLLYELRTFAEIFHVQKFIFSAFVQNAIPTPVYLKHKLIGLDGSVIMVSRKWCCIFETYCAICPQHFCVSSCSSSLFPITRMYYRYMVGFKNTIILHRVYWHLCNCMLILAC